jgi:hypothetical protein
MPITPETLAVLRGVANTIITADLKTEVTVLHRSRAAENPYGTSGETWAGTDTWLAWIREIKATDIQNLNHQAGQVGEFEVRLPIEAIVDPGDRLVIGGDLYVVQNTNNIDTLPIFMKVTVRRIE